MEKTHENKIDSEVIINSWIDSATRVWESIVQMETNSADGSGITGAADNMNRVYKAWEPAYNTWQEFATKVNKKEMIETIVEGNKAGTESFHKLLKASMDGYSFFQKKWMESAKNIDDIFKKHDGDSNTTPEVFTIFQEIYQKEISKFLTVPPLGLSREYQEKFQLMIDKSNIFNVALLEFLYFLYVPFEKAFMVVQDTLASLANEGSLPEDSKEYYQLWLKQLENHYMALFRSSEYTNALGKVIGAMSEFVAAKQQIMQDSLRLYGIPVERDMDELYKDIYSLKKRISKLEKEGRKQKAKK